MPVLAVSASDAPDPVAAGRTITYTLNYSNTGSSGATGVVLSDTVPVNFFFNDTAAAEIFALSLLAALPISLAAGVSGSVTLTVGVASPLANGTVITDG